MKEPRNLAIVIQARVGSQRLPAKVLFAIGGKPLIGWVIARTQQATRAPRTICALPDTAPNGALADVCARFGAEVYRGSEHDVLSRYLDCSDHYGLTDVVRITGDCPLIDPAVIDRLIDAHLEGDWDLTWNPVDEPGAFPRGMDVEVVRVSALRAAAARSPAGPYREHVTLYLVDHPAEFRIQCVMPRPGEARHELRLCVDHEADAELVCSVICQMGGRVDFTLSEIIAFLDASPEVARLNDRYKQTLDHPGR
jgi:spore coat polysaccharide biosynthesis protein SpsF (cytidylyltransferase family)